MAGNSLKTVRELWKRSQQIEGFMNQALKNMVINAASEKQIETEFTVTKDMINVNGALHGGATATIADIVSTLGLLCVPGNKPGVSVNLSVNYLRSASEGEKVIVISDTIKLGRTLAFLEIRLSKKDTGELIATASHVKHVA